MILLSLILVVSADDSVLFMIVFHFINEAFKLRESEDWFNLLARNMIIKWKTPNPNTRTSFVGPHTESITY